MKALPGLLAAVVAACAVATCAPAEKAPDTILYNGRITTLDDNTGPASALAIRDGRIVAVGEDAQIRGLAGAATRMVDLGGHRVIPGLIDNHDHVIRATEYWTWEARLDGVTSREEAVRILRAKAASLPPGAWLLALGGWGEEQFTDDPRGFTLAELDAIAPDRPAFLQVRYDYAFANSAWFAAMELPLTISPGSPPGEGLAHFVERDADGRATGRLDGGFPMIALATRGFPAVSEDTQRAGIEALSETLLGYGITSVFDPGGLGIRPESYSRLQAMADAGALRLRFFYSLWDGVVNTPDGAQHLIHRLETERPFGGSPFFDRLAAGEVLYQPFHWDNPLSPAHPTDADRAIARDIFTAAAEHGWPLEIHAIQPETIAGVLDVAEEVNRTTPIAGLRWSIAHADNIGSDEIARAKALGMTLKLRSVAVVGGLEGVFQRFGERAFHMPPFRAVATSGIPFGLGSDGTKGNQINPFVTLSWAVSGKMLDGETVLKETLDREEALAAHSRNNAYLLFREKELGRIAPGYRADLVVLNRDYFTVPEDEIRDIRSLATIVDGHLMYGAIGDWQAEVEGDGE